MTARDPRDPRDPRDAADDAPRRDFHLPPSPARLQADLDEELRFHMEGRREELVAAGMSPEEADREVRRRFGDAESYRREAREIDLRALRAERRAAFLATLWRETRRSARTLLRERAFTGLSFATLALGIGAAIAMFTVLDAVVLKPLPYPDAGELVSVLHPTTVPGSGDRQWGVSPGGYVHFQDHARSIRDFGVYRNVALTVTGDGEAEQARVAIATPGVLRALRARAAEGRLLDETDESGTGRVVLLSHEFHQRRYGGDPGVIGRQLQTAGASYEIVGVAAPGLALPLPGPFADASDLSALAVDLWLPMRVDRAGPFYNNHPNVGIARLAPGVTAEAATTELATLLRRFPEWMPLAYTQQFLDDYRFRVEARPLRESVLGATVPRVIWMLFGAVIVVLIVATANVGSLFLARMEARRRESAVRTALGAEGAQMAAHYLSESLLVCLGAAVAGVGVAAIALKVLLAVAPTDIPRLHSAALGSGSVVFGIGVGVLLGAAIGLLPLLRRALDLDALRDGGRTVVASRRQRVARSGLVAGQLALTMLLLAAAGVMLRSFDALRRVEPGFDPGETLVFDVSLPFTRYDTREKAIAFHKALAERLAALPGVVAVGAGAAPLRDFGTGCAIVFREARPYAVGEEPPCVATPTAFPGFFDALGIVVEGRRPDWRDVDGRTQSVVVTRALADRLWPGEDPIGKGIGSNGQDSPWWYRVSGVVPELRAESFDRPPTEAVFYAPTGLRPDQRTDAINYPTYFVRTDGADAATLTAAARAILRELDPTVPLIQPGTMKDVVARSLARSRFILVLLGVAATVALALSAVGTYGIVSYLVTQRRVEIGIRMALGATVPSVVRMVVLQSLRLGLVGVALGAAASLAGTRAMRSLLFEVQATDPQVLSAVAALLIAVVLTASFVPARRAARIQPVEAMRGS